MKDKNSDKDKNRDLLPLPIPICAECVHSGEYGEALSCFRKKPAIDLVDGSEIFLTPKRCRIERAEMGWAWWACGKKGRFFEKKELPAIDRGEAEEG